MALHCWPKFRIVCDTRDSPLHLFLLGSSSHSAVQERLISAAVCCKPPTTTDRHKQTLPQQIFFAVAHLTSILNRLPSSIRLIIQQRSSKLAL